MTSSDNLIEFPKPSVKLKVENLKMEIDKAINDKDVKLRSIHSRGQKSVRRWTSGR